MKKIFPFLLFPCLLSALISIAQDTGQVVHLWPNGAPGYESRRNEPERMQGNNITNVHHPSITVYLPPKEKATGAAVIICPGGSHRTLVFNTEGRDPALFLNKLGIAAFVLKYRLCRADSTYSLVREVKQDAYRAIRLVRSKAKEWNIDTGRVGIWGFSAGGEVVTQVAYGNGSGDEKATDPVDRLNGKPSFQIQVYPAPFGIPDVIPADAPPAFLITGSNDDCCSMSVINLLERYRRARLPVEAHVIARAKHGFKLGYADNSLLNVKLWPQLLVNWLTENILVPNAKQIQ